MEPVDACDADMGEDAEEEELERGMDFLAMAWQWPVFALIIFAGLSVVGLAFGRPLGADVVVKIDLAILVSFVLAFTNAMPPY